MPSSDRVRHIVAAALLTCAAAALQGATPKARYDQALGREQMLRRDLEATHRKSEASSLLLRRIRTLVSEYEQIARRHPQSRYSDNALYQGALLSADAFWSFGEEIDRQTALRLLATLKTQFATSSLNRQTTAHAKRLNAAKAAPAQSTPGIAAGTTGVTKPDERAALKAIRREVLPDAVRITLELEREASFHEERLDAPPRVFIDLQQTRAADELKDKSLAFSEDVVRQVRVGRQTGGATRVVLDLQGAARHSVYALYNPYRVVIDFERAAESASRGPEDRRLQANVPLSGSRGSSDPRADSSSDQPGATWHPEPPAAPATNKAGGFSISRQLGLGISRVVIDAGHGGHDPGARVKGLNEADLTLDVAERLEKLLLKVPDVQVTMTRRTNAYIPLEERTAIANRAGADLFLSIHANASRNPRARGIETYFLNFAPNPEAEAIAARENAGSSRTMHHLPDIVKAIALNNKIDESRDFARLIQTSMTERLQKANRDAKSLGVKQAPFMVLIGATMPSVLAEISFLTNRQEAVLLKTASYRQAIAEALFNGISKYQKSLKAAQTVAAQ